MVTARESNESVARTADSTAAASLLILAIIYFPAGWQAGRGADDGAMAAAGEDAVREAVLCRGDQTWGPVFLQIKSPDAGELTIQGRQPEPGIVTLADFIDWRLRRDQGGRADHRGTRVSGGRPLQAANGPGEAAAVAGRRSSLPPYRVPARFLGDNCLRIGRPTRFLYVLPP